MPAGGAGDTVLLETVKRGEKKIQADIKTGDKGGESRPPQTEQPAIEVAPSPGVRPHFDELDLTSANRNLTGLSPHVHLIRDRYQLVNKLTDGLEDLLIDILLRFTCSL